MIAVLLTLVASASLMHVPFDAGATELPTQF